MNRSVTIGYGFLVVAILMWSGNAIIARAAMLTDVPPVIFNFIRWSSACLIFLPFSARGVWRHRRIFIEKWWYFAALGLASVTCFNIFFYIGLKHTTAIQGSLIQAILPVLVLILVVTVLRERINRLQIMGVVLSLLGAAVILLRGNPELGLSLRLNVGDLWCLAAVFAWAIQLLLLRWKPPEIAMPEFMTVLIAWGIVLMVPALLWEISTGAKLILNATNLMFLAYVAIVAGVFGTTLFNAGAIRVGPATSGYFGNLYPVFASVLAVLLLGERFEWYHGLGGALVLGGIYFATMARRKAALAAE
jgi:drug/metabolite transporter (DMT)-like permease